MERSRRGNAPRIVIASALGTGLAAAMVWYYDVYVYWQPRLFPFAVAALTAGIILLTLLVLHMRGEKKPALLWKTALSALLFTGAILLGVSALVNNWIGRGGMAKQAAAVALPLCAAQVFALYALLLHKKAGAALLSAGLAIAMLTGAGLFLSDGIAGRYYRTRVMTRGGLAPYQPAEGRTAIHFLNVSGDAILLESDGLFALIDAGAGSYGPYVLGYVKRVTGGRLEFVLGTHAHADHIGGFETLLLDPDVTVGRAFLKRYHEHAAFQLIYEYGRENQRMYDRMVSALDSRGTPLIQDFTEETFLLGAFTLTIFNGEYDGEPWDENDNSLGLLAEAFGLRAFLGGDMNDYGGDETRLAPRIGKVDLLKAPHHGCEGSNTAYFLATLCPRAVVIALREIDLADARFLGPMRRFRRAAGAQRIMLTGDFGGIVAVFDANGMQYCAIGECL